MGSPCYDPTHFVIKNFLIHKNEKNLNNRIKFSLYNSLLFAEFSIYMTLKNISSIDVYWITFYLNAWKRNKPVFCISLKISRYCGGHKNLFVNKSTPFIANSLKTALRAWVRKSGYVQRPLRALRKAKEISSSEQIGTMKTHTMATYCWGLIEWCASRFPRLMWSAGSIQIGQRHQAYC